jgi:signal transduction histidine kinase
VISANSSAQPISETLAPELAPAQLDVERYLAAVSHELESSLLVLTGSLDLLHDSIPVPSSEQEEHLERIDRTTGRMRRLLAKVREFAWTKREMEMSRFSLQGVVDEALEMLAHSIEERRAQVIVLDPLPVVWADRDQLLHLIQNLLSNAIKFGPDGGWVTISTSRVARSWVIAIDDEGPGIAPENRHRVFEPFRRLRETGHVPGTGLGLAICRRVAENHAGTLTIEESDAGGATFVFTLPDSPVGPAR